MARIYRPSWSEVLCWIVYYLAVAMPMHRAPYLTSYTISGSRACAMQWTLLKPRNLRKQQEDSKQ